MLRRVNFVTTLLAGFGMLATPLQAAPPTSSAASGRSALQRPAQRADSVKSTSVVRKLVIRDVALDASGRLVGYLVDTQGRPLAKQKLRVSNGKKDVAQTVTTAKGAFQVSVPRAGVYSLNTDTHSYVVRAWTQKTAPPSASRQALLVAGSDRVVRGNLAPAAIALGPGGAILTTAAVAAITIGVASEIHENNKDDDKADISP